MKRVRTALLIAAALLSLPFSAVLLLPLPIRALQALRVLPVSPTLTGGSRPVPIIR